MSRRNGSYHMNTTLDRVGFLSDISEGEMDSGLDSGGEENFESDRVSARIPKSLINDGNMRAFCELNGNIETLEAEIINGCDRLLEAVERRRAALLRSVQQIREEKLKSLQRNDDLISSKDNHLLGCIKNGSPLGSCLRFVTDESIFSLIDEYGTIDEGRASAEKCEASGVGLKYGIADEPTQFELKTFDRSGELSWVEQDKVDVFITKDNQVFPCVVQNKCTGVYDILYELQQPGIYEINVQVNGHHINQSPYKCNIFEKCDLKFFDTEDKPEWTFQSGDKSALVEKTEIRRTSKLYSNITPPAKAWKVRVTTACTKIKLKFGYSNVSTYIPDLYDEYFCKFNLSELISNEQQTPHHHTYMSQRRHRHSRNERKQSTFLRSSLTFLIFLDSESKIIHAAVEGTQHEKKSSFKDDGQPLVPFIGIKHFCKNASCPRPMLVFA